MRMTVAGLCLLCTLGFATAQENQADTSAMGAQEGIQSPPVTQGLSGVKSATSPTPAKSDAAPASGSQAGTTPDKQADPGGSAKTGVDAKVDPKK